MTTLTLTLQKRSWQNHDDQKDHNNLEDRKDHDGPGLRQPRWPQGPWKSRWPRETGRSLATRKKRTRKQCKGNGILLKILLPSAAITGGKGGKGEGGKGVNFGGVQSGKYGNSATFLYWVFVSSNRMWTKRHCFPFKYHFILQKFSLWFASIYWKHCNITWCLCAWRNKTKQKKL